ncbi:MAG: hypothetical protein IKC82_01980 [Lentisphaeria bacterium]|nr:hypothetical protein [Lentisphaeria bacterium]
MKSFPVKKFISPDAEFYPGYFWVLNSPMNEENLLDMLRDMNSHGAKTICIHPSPKGWSAISLAEPDYLSSEYLELMDKVHAEAEKLGMHSYFYDEGGFPAGTSVGMVLESDPAKFSRKFAEKDPETGKFVIRDEYNSDYEYFYPPKGYPNLLEKGVGERFIELSHEKLKTVLGKYFGKTILYTFDDEPALPGYFNTQVLGWCSDFSDEFFKRKGYRIEPFIPEVAGKPAKQDPPSLLQHRIDYCDVRSQLFVERFLIPLKKWARANGIASGGHLGGENAPEGNLFFCYGHIMRALRAMDLPGVDIIWRQIFPEITPKRKKVFISKGSFDTVNSGAEDAPFTKYASSVARQAGHCNVLSEDFAAYGAGLTPQVMKFVIDHQLVRGANHFVFSNIPHGYFDRMLPAGCRPKFGKYHPFWDWFDMIHNYIARLSSLLHMGKPVVDTLLYYDIRSIWCGSDTMKKAVTGHYTAAAELLRNQIDFDFADDDALCNGKVKGDTFRVGKMSYKYLVIPPTRWMDEKAAKAVDRFRRAGGKVYSTAEISRIPATLQISPPQSKLRVTKRRCGSAILYFITSENCKPVSCNITIPETGKLLLFDAWSGKRFELERKGDTLPWKFPPFGSLALVVDPSAKADAAYPVFSPGRKKIKLTENWQIRPVRKCCFDRDSYAIIPVNEPARPAKLGDWKEFLGQWFSGEALYSIEFDSPSDRQAKLSLGKVCYVSEAILNGKSLGRSFSDPAEFFTGGILKKGKNHLQIRVVNTPANSVLDPEVIEYWDKHYPESVYQQMNRTFEAESLESGLFGPVTLHFS